MTLLGVPPEWAGHLAGAGAFLYDAGFAVPVLM